MYNILKNIEDVEIDTHVDCQHSDGADPIIDSKNLFVPVLDAENDVVCLAAPKMAEFISQLINKNYDEWWDVNITNKIDDNATNT